MDVDLHIATADLGGWDTHEHQPWVFNNLVKTLSESVMAFYNDLNAYHDKLTILVMSEFGRRVKGNRSNGTDHGYGGVMFALGKNIKGGQMYGKWNGYSRYNRLSSSNRRIIDTTLRRKRHQKNLPRF